MKAKELIEILKEADEDADVFFCYPLRFPVTVKEAEIEDGIGKKKVKVLLS